MMENSSYISFVVLGRPTFRLQATLFMAIISDRNTKLIQSLPSQVYLL